MASGVADVSGRVDSESRYQKSRRQNCHRTQINKVSCTVADQPLSFFPTKSGKYLAYLAAPSLVSAPTLPPSNTITTPPHLKTYTVAQSYSSPTAATLDKSTALCFSSIRFVHPNRLQPWKVSRGHSAPMPTTLLCLALEIVVGICSECHANGFFHQQKKLRPSSLTMGKTLQFLQFRLELGPLAICDIVFRSAYCFARLTSFVIVILC